MDDAASAEAWRVSKHGGLKNEWPSASNLYLTLRGGHYQSGVSRHLKTITLLFTRVDDALRAHRALGAARHCGLNQAGEGKSDRENGTPHGPSSIQ